MNRVSLVIPCYNGAATIARTLDSVLRQTYQDFEAIVIDDGSTDRTAEILAAYAAADPRIRVIRKPNGGVSSARNLGIASCSGEFVAFLDADDELLPSYMEKMTARILETGSDGCACNFTGNPMFHSYLLDRVYDLTAAAGFLEFYQETFGIMVPWNKMYRRACVQSRFDESVHFNEDELFGLSQLTHMRKMATVSDVLYIYHIPEPQTTGQKEENSCIVRTGRQEAFWENKTSFWYKCVFLLPKRREILRVAREAGRENLPEDDALVYVRAVDFLFWELSAYIFMGVPDAGLHAEVLNVMTEPAFIAGMRALSACGIRYAPLAEQAFPAATARFADLCAAAQHDALQGDGTLAFPHIFFGFFIALFCREEGQTLLPLSPLSRMQQELRDGETAAARYVTEHLREAALCGAI